MEKSEILLCSAIFTNDWHFFPQWKCNNKWCITLVLHFSTLLVTKMWQHSCNSHQRKTNSISCTFTMKKMNKSIRSTPYFGSGSGSVRNRSDFPHVLQLPSLVELHSQISKQVSLWFKKRNSSRSRSYCDSFNAQVCHPIP